jgi:penicillin-binding protein 1C
MIINEQGKVERIFNILRRTWVFRIFSKRPYRTVVCLCLFIGYYLILPEKLFERPYSVVVESNNGQLLGAKIAADGQWRFPAPDSVPEKFKLALLSFEDQYFYYHPGVNPVAIWNALVSNFKADKIKRGGSTLTQQVVRLAREGKKRTYFEKLIEGIWSTRLEIRYSKDDILLMYAAHAPFGGNVVGLEMASWRYFGVRPDQLSWAEAATLAVLPNAPSLIYPGKNREKLQQKRNRVLKKMFDKQVFDEITYTLAINETIPEKPYPLPQLATHFVERIAKTNTHSRFISTLDFDLQQRLSQLAQTYYNTYKENEVYNLSILVIDVETRNVVGYVGNSPTDDKHSKDVDICVAPRSTGSILKPFLFAEMLSNGLILPSTLVEDIPTQISGYAPQNYNQTFDGAIPAWKALSRSLNIPAVLLLQKYGVNNFYEDLQFYKQHFINKKPSHYGLSLILGGAESSLWDICSAYAGYVGTLTTFFSKQGRYRTNEFTQLNVSNERIVDFGKLQFQPVKIDASSVYFTFQALQEVNRVAEDEAWRYYSSSNKVAWKTGTSFGNRDAWAVGMSDKYVVGVWVGNANGEGRPELTGVGSASPLLFDVFNCLPPSAGFKRPETGMSMASICKESGYLAGPNCEGHQKWIPLRGEETDVCPYHFLVNLDKNQGYQVNTSCESIENIVQKKWFQLPPVVAYYYKRKNPTYTTIPPFRDDCSSGNNSTALAFIYPNERSVIYLTKDFNGQIQPLVVKVAYNHPNKTLFWFVNNEFIGSTTDLHEMSLPLQEGTTTITVTDEKGNEIQRDVRLISS